MVDNFSINDEEIFEFQNFDKKISQKEIETFLTESTIFFILENISFSKIEFVLNEDNTRKIE
jgi:hypothetical protein